ncbi:hypothetical protein [Paenarthrobacter sp. YJN-5]|uniref:hypothetical protein n=1 Tax=Paenarthrobacter sp. YJN-5 TaxID=2735316 RepID=UPI0018778FF3|nr:hypothetical protein [Paenarthrobacter sp. YJN-5]QOT15900.1 hypothetical protein HMI59_04380 [Paenarthrobacter sp. YJN-5]
MTTHPEHHSLPHLLEPIQERLNAATAGPWDWDHSNFRRVLEGKGGEQVLTCAALLYPERRNQEFIANAPTDTARLLAAVKAVLAECDHMDEIVSLRSAVEAALRGEA